MMIIILITGSVKTRWLKIWYSAKVIACCKHNFDHNVGPLCNWTIRCLLLLLGTCVVPIALLDHLASKCVYYKWPLWHLWHIGLHHLLASTKSYYLLTGAGTCVNNLFEVWSTRAGRVMPVFRYSHYAGTVQCITVDFIICVVNLSA